MFFFFFSSPKYKYFFRGFLWNSHKYGLGSLRKTSTEDILPMIPGPLCDNWTSAHSPTQPKYKYDLGYILINDRSFYFSLKHIFGLWVIVLVLSHHYVLSLYFINILWFFTLKKYYKNDIFWEMYEVLIEHNTWKFNGLSSLPVFVNFGRNHNYDVKKIIIFIKKMKNYIFI